MVHCVVVISSSGEKFVSPCAHQGFETSVFTKLGGKVPVVSFIFFGSKALPNQHKVRLFQTKFRLIYLEKINLNKRNPKINKIASHPQSWVSFLIFRGSRKKYAKISENNTVEKNKIYGKYAWCFTENPAESTKDNPQAPKKFPFHFRWSIENFSAQFLHLAL